MAKTKKILERRQPREQSHSRDLESTVCMSHSQRQEKNHSAAGSRSQKSQVRLTAYPDSGRGDPGKEEATHTLQISVQTNIYLSISTNLWFILELYRKGESSKTERTGHSPWSSPRRPHPQDGPHSLKRLHFQGRPCHLGEIALWVQPSSFARTQISTSQGKENKITLLIMYEVHYQAHNKKKSLSPQRNRRAQPVSREKLINRNQPQDNPAPRISWQEN